MAEPAPAMPRRKRRRPPPNAPSMLGVYPCAYDVAPDDEPLEPVEPCELVVAHVVDVIDADAMTPEHALRYAVLERALSDIRRGRRFAAHATARRLADEAMLWALDNDEAWPFAFVPVCHALGIEPGYLRRKLGIESGPVWAR